MTHDRDRHRRDPVAREAAGDEERAREHLAAVAVPEHRERPALRRRAAGRRHHHEGHGAVDARPPAGARGSAPRRSGARASGTRVTSTSRSRRRRPRPAAAPRGAARRPGIRRAARRRPAPRSAGGAPPRPTWRRRTRRDRIPRGNHARPPPSGAVMSAGSRRPPVERVAGLLEERRDAAGGEDGGDRDPIHADAAPLERAAEEAEGRAMLRAEGRPAARPEDRREARRRLDGPAGRVAELARHHEPVARLRLEEALGTRVEREGRRDPRPGGPRR